MTTVYVEHEANEPCDCGAPSSSTVSVAAVFSDKATADAWAKAATDRARWSSFHVSEWVVDQEAT